MVFSDADLANLRSHGFVIIWDRVIFDAQPPIDSETLAWVTSQCSGPLPADLLELWSITAGGSIDYDVSIQMGGGTQSFSWTELFYRGASTYFDLDGWVSRELEFAQEDGTENGLPAPQTIDWLPIGGFEYLDRVYVDVRAVDPQSTQSRGGVQLWMQGLPPAWTYRLHENSQATYADNLSTAFSQLYLAEHPVTGVDPYRQGTDFLHYFNTRVEEHGLDRDLGDRLVQFYCEAVLDWQTLLANGSILGKSVPTNTAIEAAVNADDSTIIRQLAAVGVRFDEGVRGTALPTDLAIRHGSHAVLATLLDAGAKVSPDLLDGLYAPLTADLVLRLVAAGAQTSLQQAAEAVAVGAGDGARVMVDNVAGMRRKLFGGSPAKQFAAAQAEALASYEQKLRDQQSEKVFHWLGEDGLQERIDRLRSFRW